MAGRGQRRGGRGLALTGGKLVQLAVARRRHSPISRSRRRSTPAARCRPGDSAGCSTSTAAQVIPDPDKPSDPRQPASYAAGQGGTRVQLGHRGWLTAAEQAFLEHVEAPAYPRAHPARLRPTCPACGDPRQRALVTSPCPKPERHSAALRAWSKPRSLRRPGRTVPTLDAGAGGPRLRPPPAPSRAAKAGASSVLDDRNAPTRRADNRRIGAPAARPAARPGPRQRRCCAPDRRRRP